MSRTVAARQAVANNATRNARRAAPDKGRLLTISGSASGKMAVEVSEDESPAKVSETWSGSEQVAEEVEAKKGSSSVGGDVEADWHAAHLRICWRSCSPRSRSWIPARCWASLAQTTRTVTWTGLGSPLSGRERRVTKLDFRQLGVETRRPFSLTLSRSVSSVLFWLSARKIGACGTVRG